MHATCGGQCIGARSVWHIVPSETITTGYCVTFSGHAYGCGGGGLHVAPCGHVTFTAAVHVLPDLKIVHDVPAAGCGRGRGGFMITGGRGGGGCCCTGGGCGSDGGGGFIGG